MKNILKDLNELFYPSGIKCIFCDGELNTNTPYSICDECDPEYNTVFCSRCGRPVVEGNKICDHCQNETIHFVARSAFAFCDKVAKLVYRFKYNNERYLARPMAEFMADVYYTELFTADYITFVPLHKKRFRKRGYNQSELLAKSLSECLDIPLIHALNKVRYTKNMAKLNSSERKNLIKDSFLYCHDEKLSGKKVLLIDDVYTTGATAGECADVLTKNGAEVEVLTFASVRAKQYLVKNETRQEKKQSKKWYKVRSNTP